MIGLVIVTHGRLAEEFVFAMEHVVGPQAAVEAICIGPEDDMERRRQDILAACGRVDTGARRHPADRHVRRHAVEPGHLGDGADQGRGDRRPEPADADQAGQRAQPPEPGRRASPAPRKPAANTSPSPPTCWPARSERSGQPHRRDRQQARPARPRLGQVRQAGRQLRRRGAASPRTARPSTPARSWA